MNELLMVCERIAPELMTVLKDRYKLLSHLAYEEPLGRRSLALATDISERAVRSHVDALRGNGLVEISKPGHSTKKHFRVLWRSSRILILCFLMSRNLMGRL